MHNFAHACGIIKKTLAYNFEGDGYDGTGSADLKILKWKQIVAMICSSTTQGSKDGKRLTLTELHLFMAILPSGITEAMDVGLIVYELTKMIGKRKNNVATNAKECVAFVLIIIRFVCSWTSMMQCLMFDESVLQRHMFKHHFIKKNYIRL